MQRTGRRTNKNTYILTFLVAMLVVVGGTPTVGQESPPDEPALMAPEDLDRILDLHRVETEDVRLVLLPTVVVDKKGRPVRGLNEADFQVLEDYVPHPIQYFGTEDDNPVSIAFLLDLSGSMRHLGKLDEAKQAINFFVNNLSAGDQFGLIGFADDQVSWITDFTNDVERFQLRLGVQEGYGQTALFDALGATPRLVDEQTRGRKAIVLLTDGHDTASRLNTFQAMQLARSVDVPIYCVAFTTLADRMSKSADPGMLILKRFSEETGGRLFSVNDPVELKEAVIEIQTELRFQYVIGYRPRRTTWDGAFRRIKVELARKGLEVRTRRGYYAQP